MKISKKLVSLTAGFAAILMAVSGPGFAEKAQLINGAGATFPYPIYSKWFSEYQKVNPSVAFNYQSIGSGGGVKQIMAKTVDFGASDAFLSNDELFQAPGKLFHIPMVAGAVVVTYNIPGTTEQINLKPDVIADIFLGKIKNWNDPRIAEANPNLNLPDGDIIVVHRSDGSGTTSIFTDYLANVSGAWKIKVGQGKSVSWPVGLGGKGNEGVAGTIKQTPNSIGYVEYAYAKQNNLPAAKIQNKAGNFISPSPEATSAALVGKLNSMPDDFRVSIVNPDGQDAYPIAGLTWILIYQKQKDAVKGKAVIEFLKWALHDGSGYAKELLYAPIPQEMVEKIDNKLAKVQVG